MEDTYTFKENECLSEEFINKLNNGYAIKTITFELYNEIKTFNEYYVGYKKINTITQYYLDTFNGSIIYFNNVIMYYVDPFTNFTNSRINTEYYMLYIDECEEEINYKTCKIYLSYHNLKSEYTFKSIISIQSNYFNTEEELKKFMIEWTDNTYIKAYDDWLNTFQYGIFIIYQNNKDNIKTLIQKNYNKNNL